MALVAASVFLLVLLFGCIGDAKPSVCAGVSPAKLPNCIYINAVSEQNPFYCYSIANESQRETCLKDASNPAMKKALERSLPSQRDSVFNDGQADDDMPPPPPPQGGAPPAPSSQCDSANATQKDICLREAAIGRLAVSECEQVSTSSIRAQCISTIAQRTKNLSACNLLANESSRALCNFYAQG